MKCFSQPDAQQTDVLYSPNCRRERSKVPYIVRQCIEEVEKRGIDEVGIYRISGVATDIQALKSEFDTSKTSLTVFLPSSSSSLALFSPLFLSGDPRSNEAEPRITFHFCFEHEAHLSPSGCGVTERLHLLWSRGDQPCCLASLIMQRVQF